MLNRSTQYGIILLLLVLCSCGGNSRVKPDASTSVITSRSQAKPNAQVTTENPKDLIVLAEQKKSPERESLLLQAAAIYVERNEADSARNLLTDMKASQLSEPNFVKYSQVSAGVALQTGDIESARRILTNTRLEQQLKALEPQQEAVLRELRAQTFERNGQLQDSIAERITGSAVITDTKAANINQEKLWQTLMNLPMSDLQANALKGSGGITQGWYSLAALSKNNAQDMKSQIAALTRWQAQWRSHPAANNLPADLRSLQTALTQQPKKIALLLPLQGRLAEAGDAVSDGFFAAYYQTMAAELPNVRQYDSSQDAAAAYQQAVTDGADFIIGPVDKEGVNRISQLPSLKIPLLSLNYPDQQPTLPLKNLYQFGLAVEDEARQVARQGIQNGYKRALIIATAQEVSERSALAFTTEWQKFGGLIVGKSIFASQDKFSENFRALMSLDESESRASLLQQQLATKLEFTPRRRADVDMIFIAVTPAQGRQIKPTLVFQYANNIPVYATSSIYSGDIDATNNEDLDGILFNTLPWVFDNDNAEKRAIAQNTKSAAVYGRLHALGTDAFHLYSRLTQLKQSPEMRIYGATGSLQLMSDGRIEREQMWARFSQGIAEPLANVSDVQTDDKSN